jgi:hypothetical protein
MTFVAAIIGITAAALVWASIRDARTLSHVPVHRDLTAATRLDHLFERRI